MFISFFILIDVILEHLVVLGVAYENGIAHHAPSDLVDGNNRLNLSCRLVFQGRARHFWQRLLLGKLKFHSLVALLVNLLNSMLVWEHHGCEISLLEQRKKLHQSYLLMRLD